MNTLSILSPFLIQITAMNIQFIPTLILFLFMLSLIPIAVADWRTRYIPDRYHVITASLAFAYLLYPYINSRTEALSPSQTLGQMLFTRFSSALFCACPFIVLYFIREDIGGADAKFAAIVGLFCSIEKGLSILLFGTALTACVILLQRLYKRASKSQTYPLLPTMVLFLFLHTLSLFLESF